MTLLHLKPLFDWLQLHIFIAGLATCVITFFECLIPIGLLVPGTVFMTAIGTLVGMGVLPFLEITGWAIVGAILGDVLSFWLGNRYNRHATHFWLFRRYPKLLKKGEDFFHRHGGKSIFIGRFIGPIRPVLPFIAGMINMPYRQFFIADIISAIAWPPLYMLPGLLLGQASQQLPPETALKLIFIVILLLSLLWLLYSLLKRGYDWFRHLLNKQLVCLWHVINNHLQLRQLTSFLIDPYDPQSHAQLRLALIFIVCLIGFSCLAFSVAHQGVATYFNHPVYYLMHSLRQPILDKFLISMTELSPRVLALFWASVLLILILKREFWKALHWGAAGLLSFGLGGLVKHALHIPRPTGLIHTPSGASFPSGHTLNSVTLLGFYTLLATAQQSKQWMRTLSYATALTTISLIMFSRVYLTAHWLSDVLGGLLLGVTILSGVLFSYRRKNLPVIKPTLPINSLALVILSSLWASNLAYEYHQQLQNYQLASVPKPTLSNQDWWNIKKTPGTDYLNNHFGKSTELLSVQWADKLSGIETYLIGHGWQTLQKKGWLTTLHQLFLRQHTLLTPLFVTNHADRQPALVMIKSFSPANVLILKLWPAFIQLSDGTPLWFGLLHSQKTWYLKFPSSATTKKLVISPDLFQLLETDLSAYQIKKNTYTLNGHLKTSLLIRKDPDRHKPSLPSSI